MTTKSQEERAQIMGTTAAIGIASRACENYVKRLMAVNAEAMNFLNSRLREDVELGESFARCKSWEEVNELQQAWGRKAFEDYASMSQKMMELTSLMADNPWASVTPEEQAKPAVKTVEVLSAAKPKASEPAVRTSAEKPEVTAKAADPTKAPATAKSAPVRKRVSKPGGTVTPASVAKPATAAKRASSPKASAQTTAKSSSSRSATRPQKA